MVLKNDLFISYAHLDNDPLPKSADGWVTLFHQRLAYYLKGFIGREVEIWRDRKLQGNDDFTAEIEQQLSATALLISVVTPRYVVSDWCTKEVQDFCNNWGEMIRIDNKSRVFKVIKLPVPKNLENKVPEVMKPDLGFPFYVLSETQTPQVLGEAFGEESETKFNLKVNDLAYQVAQLISQMQPEPDVCAPSQLAPAAPISAAVVTPAAAAKSVVYLAHCSDDRSDDRDAIKAVLRGYTILPEKKLPEDPGSLVSELDDLLRRCRLSIHIIGSDYGDVPQGSSKSVSVLENDRAKEASRTSRLKRIIWIPSGLRPQSSDQQVFIDSILREEPQYRADLLRGTVEDLKRAIDVELGKIEIPDVPVTDKPVLFISDCSFDRHEDRGAIIAKLLDRGYPILPDVPLPTEEASFFGELAAMLSRSKLSLHIVGNDHCFVPEGSENSIGVLENQLAIEYSKKCALKRIIWLPEGTEGQSERQREFIASLNAGENSPAAFGAKLIRGDVDAFTRAIDDALEEIEAPPPATVIPMSVAAERKLVYLICDQRDLDDAMPLLEFLGGQGVDLEVPNFDGSPAMVSQANEDLLKRCDAALIFYGKGEDSWKSSVDSDLLKAAGYRTKPALEPYAYLAAPDTPKKKILVVTKKPRVIDGRSGFSAAAFADFLNTISRKAKP